MPAIINIAANLALGASLAVVARDAPALRQSRLGWPVLFLVGFEAVVFTPIATYLFRFYPQWSMLYWFDPQMFPGLESWIGVLSLAAVLLNFAAAIGGFFIARAGILEGQTWMWIAPLSVAGLLAAYVVLMFGDRVFYIGDYDSFWQGNAELLLARLAGWIGIALYLAAVAFVLWVRSRFSQRDPKLL